MAEDTLTIPQQPELSSSEDYEYLRSEGIRFISELSGKIWTDYNPHDPGITIMELLCYAITDLGYRTAFPMEDLLSSADKSEVNFNFFTAKEILPVNPVTENDLRKLVIDVDQVKNAWIQTVRDYEQPVYIDRTNCRLTLNYNDATRVLPISGLYNVLLEFEDAPDGKEEDELSFVEKELRKEREDQIIENVRKTLMAHRGLCEDVLSVNSVGHLDIAICADLDVEQNVNVAELQARIYQFAIDYFSPTLQFYTLSEMLAKDKTPDEIFEGPLLTHGFIDNDELEKADLRSEIYVSDIISAIMDMEGVIAVREIKLIPYTGDDPGEPLEWMMQIPSGRAGHLARSRSKLMFYKNDLPYMAHPDEVNQELRELQQTSTRVRLKNHENDLEIPEGSYRNLTDYPPVQNEFPLVYGIGPAGLPREASDKRIAQAKQLKSFLAFFEQVLTNYLAQLANVKKLFSFEPSVQENDDETFTRTGKTYFVQQLKEISLFNDNEALYELLMNSDNDSRETLRNSMLDRFWKTYLESPEGAAALAAIDAETNAETKAEMAAAIISDIGSYYEDQVQKMSETDAVFADRRNRLLNHLLARFCEDLTEYSLLLFAEYGKEQGALKLIADKETLLSEYAELSRDRNRAYNYKPENPFRPDDLTGDNGIWNTHNVAGLKQRIIRLLGMERHSRPTIVSPELEMKSEVDNSDPMNPVTLWWLALADNEYPTEYLLLTEKDEDRDTVEALLYRMMLLGGTAGQYKSNSSSPYYFELFSDSSLTTSLAKSRAFTGPDAEKKRDKALARTISFFRGDDKGYIRRTIAPTNISISDRLDNSDPSDPKKMWKVTVADPLASGEVLLVTEENEDRSCAEGFLHYMLHNGDNAANYKKRGTNPYYFELMSDCVSDATVIARSRDFTGDNAQANRDALLELTIRFFRYACDLESFHLVEHILLRPRTELDTLLPACVQCPLPDGVTDPRSVTKQDYTVKITRLTMEEEAEGEGSGDTEDDEDGDSGANKWQFTISNQDESEVLSSEGYSSINACLHGLHATRQYGAFEIPYEIDKNDKAVVDTSKGIGIYADSFSSKTRELLVRGKKIYPNEESMRQEIQKLQDFFKFNGDILPDEEAEALMPFVCTRDEDPYSFRVSFVLPGWPTRFRSLNFRKYVEKTIRSETPAHIYVRICWIDFEEMQQFEDAYEAWVRTLAVNAIPNPTVTTTFINELFNLNNIYPTATLHDCESVTANDSRIVLGQTTLGSL